MNFRRLMSLEFFYDPIQTLKINILSHHMIRLSSLLFILKIFPLVLFPRHELNNQI